MPAFIVTFVIGIVCVCLGISHTKGNISSLHSYHRSRVREEDRIPFGKKVGLGTIVIGIALMLFSIFSVITLVTEQSVYTVIGTAVLIAGLITGIGISFYAMIKYNKGIF